MNARAVVIGLAIGVVFGAGIASLVWSLTGGGDGGDSDVAAVCGVVERTPVPDENTSLEDLRRWAVGEVMPSVAKADPEYQPLADALSDAVRSMRQFDFEKMRAAVDRAKGLCAGH
ncbi:hypothetical protein [Actinophytocola glycyrrhizae]|uniref:Uncharacterized protein n=1 Tax=Actinophytocola glycyrrhizae TaxID=2044873 RepID=A0ABV9S1E2_9PSEU